MFSIFYSETSSNILLAFVYLRMSLSLFLKAIKFLMHRIFFLAVGKWQCYLLSPVWLFATPRTVASQAPLSMEFSRQEYWSGLSFPSPGILPNPGIEPESPALQAAVQANSFSSEPPGKLYGVIYLSISFHGFHWKGKQHSYFVSLNVVSLYLWLLLYI